MQRTIPSRSPVFFLPQTGTGRVFLIELCLRTGEKVESQKAQKEVRCKRSCVWGADVWTKTELKTRASDVNQRKRCSSSGQFCHRDQTFLPTNRFHRCWLFPTIQHINTISMLLVGFPNGSSSPWRYIVEVTVATPGLVHCHHFFTGSKSPNNLSAAICHYITQTAPGHQLQTEHA